LAFFALNLSIQVFLCNELLNIPRHKFARLGLLQAEATSINLFSFIEMAIASACQIQQILTK